MSSRALPAPADQVASAELLKALSAVERDLGWLAEMIRPLVGAGMTILTLPVDSSPRHWRARRRGAG